MTTRPSQLVRRIATAALLLVALSACDPKPDPLEPAPPRPGDPVEPRTFAAIAADQTRTIKVA
jgi:hypothetical protein